MVTSRHLTLPKRLAAVAVLALLSGCKSDKATGTDFGVLATCNSGDPVCPPSGLALGFTGTSGSPTISSSGATTVSQSTTALSVFGTTSATSNGVWLQLVGQELRSWGTLVVSGSSFSGSVPLFCGTQQVIYSFDASGARSYYRVNVTVTGCTTAALRVQLTWDASNGDIDLHLVRPSGLMNTSNDCYFANCTFGGLEWGAAGSAGNPLLDVDDTFGFGPENIFIGSGLESGDYRIVVHNYSNTSGITATIKVFLNDVEVRRWTSLTLDGASSRRYWSPGRINGSTGVVTTVDTYSSTAP